MKVGIRDIMIISIREKTSSNSNSFTTLTIGLRERRFVLNFTRYKKYGIKTPINTSDPLSVSCFWRSFGKRVIYTSVVLEVESSKNKYFMLER